MRRLIVLVVSLAVIGATFVPLPAAAAPPRFATARLIDTNGSFMGIATFAELPNGSVRVTVLAWGLTAGPHGIHVHGIGACTQGTTPAFSSAGGHFNPSGAHHGEHAGDLGNIVAVPAGLAVLGVRTTQFTLSAGPLSLRDADGSALVIHAAADDLVTDPAGNSGPRVLCGVIS